MKEEIGNGSRTGVRAKELLGGIVRFRRVTGDYFSKGEKKLLGWIDDMEKWVRVICKVAPCHLRPLSQALEYDRVL